MTAPLVILAIVLANLSLGWLVLYSFTEHRQFVAALPERLFVGLTLGIGLTGWLAVILTEIGHFSILWLGSLWLVLVLIFGIIAWQRGRLSRTAASPTTEREAAAPRLAVLQLHFVPYWAEYLLLGSWLIAAIWLFFRPHQYVNGAADAGVYINLGAEIAQNQSIVIQDDFLAGLDPALYPAFLRPLTNPVASAYLFPAFYVIGEPAGEITPQFYALHPAWQATAFALAGSLAEGVRAELLLTGLWGLLGCLAVYFTVREIAGWQTAALALAGITLNALQIWFSRYPVSETLTQYLLWTGLWGIAVWLNGRKPQPVWALLAGLSLGHFFLVRIDALFILPILGLFVIWLLFKAKEQPAFWWFVGPFALLVLHSLVHALTQSRPYFFELFNFALRLLTANPALAAGLALLGLAALVVLGRYRGQFARLERYQRPFTIALISGLFLFTAYLWFIRAAVEPAAPWQDPFSTGLIPQVNHENLVRLGWYLSPLGVWLGTFGIALLIWHFDRKTAVLLAVTLIYSGIYLWNIRANPHQIYAMRRYVPTVMPLFVLGGAIAIGWLTTHPKRWLQGAAYLLALVWLGSLAWSARGFISQVDHPELVTQLNELSQQFEPGAVLLFNDPAPIGQGDILGTPLRFIFGHDVLTLRDRTQLDTGLFEEQLRQWQQADRPIYWVMVPNGTEWPSVSWQVEPVGSYTIQTTALENVYDRRPTAVITQTWQGQIGRVLPQE